MAYYEVAKFSLSPARYWAFQVFIVLKSSSEKKYAEGLYHMANQTYELILNPSNAFIWENLSQTQISLVLKSWGLQI